VFRYILGGAIDPRSEFDYADFLVPGFLATAILWGLMSAPPASPRMPLPVCTTGSDRYPSRGSRSSPDARSPTPH
jgi:hypothetical protein